MLLLLYVLYMGTDLAALFLYLLFSESPVAVLVGEVDALEIVS